MLVVQARFRYTQNPCVGFLLVAGWCFQHFVRNPAQVNTRSTSLTINVRCWPQTWQRARDFGLRTIGIDLVSILRLSDIEERKKHLVDIKSRRGEKSHLPAVVA